ncbi:MAG: quinohemoprotein amine dehydrogenase subunit beta [Candidatus Binataceae bacterium]|jgi:quinohemoprotein amine dehydrogenase beta subunit
MNRRAILKSWAIAAVAAILLPTIPLSVGAKDYLITGTKPNLLFLIDLQARKVVRQYKIPKDGPPFSISVSADGKIAYVVTDHYGALSGIDLDSGKEVFRAELQGPGELVRSIGGIALSRDGKELFVMESVSEILPGEYKVQPSRIAVYRTDAGLRAKPVRTFNTPRRIAVLAPSTDGKIIYGVGWDVYAFDAATGKLLSTQKFFNWNRPNCGPPDLLSFWPMYEESGIYATPYYYSRTDIPETDPASQKTGMLMLDLRTGKMSLVDFENTSAAIFSAAANPRNPKEVFGVYATLSRIYTGEPPKLEQRVLLDHSYYVIDIAADGSECYLGGAMDDVAVYSTRSMKKLADIRLPGGGDMALSLMRIVHRP